MPFVSVHLLFLYRTHHSAVPEYDLCWVCVLLSALPLIALFKST